MALRSCQDDDVLEAKKAVRSFSWKTYSKDPEDDLAKSLVIAEASTRPEEKNESTLSEQWMQLFDPATSKAFKQESQFPKESRRLTHLTQWKPRRSHTCQSYEPISISIQGISQMSPQRP